jgi:hypothetical protein
MDLDDRRPAVGADEDHRSRAREEWTAASVGEEDELDRLVNGGAGRKVDERAIGDEGGIECREGITMFLEVAREERSEPGFFLGEDRGEARDPGMFGQPSEARQPGGKVAVDKGQPRAAEVHRERVDRLGGQCIVHLTACRFERRIQDGAEPGVTPVLVLRRRETMCFDPLSGTAAGIGQPARVVPVLLRAKASEALGYSDFVVCRRGHCTTPTGSDRSGVVSWSRPA